VQDEDCTAVKRKIENQEEPSAKRPTKMQPESRKLIVVCDADAISEVREKRHMKKVDVTSWAFAFCRRNKKIEKVLHMRRKGTRTEMKAQLVTSRKGSFSELDGVYGKRVIEVFQHPQKFNFKKLPWKHQEFWEITKPNSKIPIIETDSDQNEMIQMVPELESDIGVLKRSVEQLLAKKTNNVIAVNTHPGHHAGPKYVSNYCTLNNAIIAARLIKKSKPNLKVGVIDIDIHPGDGTHKFVKHNRSLVNKYVSIHCNHKFWRSRMSSDLGSNGIALRQNKNGEVPPQQFIGKIKQVLDVWRQDHLDVIIVSMGFDTLKCDPLAGFLGFQNLPADFRDVGTTLSQSPEQFLFIQEGGYDVNTVANAFEYLIKGFREGRKSLGTKP